MEFKNFSNLHIVVPAATEHRLPSHVYNSFLFNLQSKADMERTLRHVFSEANTDPFSLTLYAQSNAVLPEGQKWLEVLCLILCHHNYIRHNELPIVGLRYDPAGMYGIAAFFNRLFSELKTQGFARFAVADVTRPQANSILDFHYTFYPFYTDEAFYEWYTRQIMNNTSPLHIFTCPQSDEIVTTFITQREQAEKQLENEHPLLYRFIGELQKKEQLLHQHRMALKNKEEELASKTAYLDFLLHKTTDYSDLNEIMKIKKFYHHEYEILPIWYKRFGHIVKVLSGKRKFRSLFDHNVKKYT